MTKTFTDYVFSMIQLGNVSRPMRVAFFKAIKAYEKNVAIYGSIEAMAQGFGKIKFRNSKGQIVASPNDETEMRNAAALIFAHLKKNQPKLLRGIQSVEELFDQAKQKVADILAAEAEAAAKLQQAREIEKAQAEAIKYANIANGIAGALYPSDDGAEHAENLAIAAAEQAEIAGTIEARRAAVVAQEFADIARSRARKANAERQASKRPNPRRAAAREAEYA